jgi:hypothetical protein
MQNHLYAGNCCRRDLFSELDLVFYDTTSIYFEGEGGDTLVVHQSIIDRFNDGI